MSKYEAWISVVGDGPDERIIYRGDDMDELTEAVKEHADEVDCNVNKYYLINDYTFDYSDDFIDNKWIVKPY